MQQIEDAFKAFVARPDIAIILITQTVGLRTERVEGSHFFWSWLGLTGDLAGCLSVRLPVLTAVCPVCLSLSVPPVSVPVSFVVITF